MMEYNFGQMTTTAAFPKLHRGSPILDHFFKHLGPNCLLHMCKRMQVYINDSAAKGTKVFLRTAVFMV